MRRKAKIILICLLAVGSFILSTIAEGANWEQIEESEDGVSAFVDTGNLWLISETIVGVWVKIIMEKPEPFHSKFITQAICYEEHDCSEGKRKLLEVIFYYTNGTNENESASPEQKREWTYVTPNTLTFTVHEYLCNTLKLFHD